ncbi:MAG: hypothetical protein AB1391_01105 [Candidatus Micrarchaeota archaeon]
MDKQKNSERHSEKNNEFKELVGSIHAVECESDKIKTEYDKKITDLLKCGREKGVELREFYEKKAMDTKNKFIIAERERTEKLAEKIISDSKKEADILRAKKMDKKNTDAIFDLFLSSLG